MKIEICESLCSSWLRHIKGCQIVNQNWTLSPLWSSVNAALAQQIYDDTQHLFNIAGHKIVPLKNFLKTSECDVIGISFHNTTTGKYSVHAADIAFHRGSLGYNVSGKKASVEKVLEKTVRTAISILCYLNLNEGDIYFLSPYIIPKDKTEILKRLSDLKTITDKHGCSFRYHLICNGDFANDVMIPLTGNCKDINDDNELWLRAYQSIVVALSKSGIDIDGIMSGKVATIKATKLAALTSKASKASKKKSIANPSTAVMPSVTQGRIATMPTTYCVTHPAGMKIGEYARQIAAVISAGKVSSTELNDLQDKTYSNTKFGITYPVLVNIKNPYKANRYYTTPITYNGNTYVLCHEWVDKPKQWQGLEDFFKAH